MYVTEEQLQEGPPGSGDALGAWLDLFCHCTRSVAHRDSVAVSSSDETTCLQLCSSFGSTTDKSRRLNWHLLPSVAAIKPRFGLACSAAEHGHEAAGQCLPLGTRMLDDPCPM